MLYFTKELWNEMNERDERVRQKAQRQWVENLTKYQQYLSSITRHVPQHVIAKIDSANGFHDYTIDGLSIMSYRKNKYIAQVDVSNGSDRYYLRMEGLKQAKVEISSFDLCVLGKLTWGYHEFRLTERNTLQLAILCDMENELLFEFKRISMKTERRWKQ